MDPELETNLVLDNQSTYSTQRGCSSHLEFDFKARPPADCFVVGRLTQCILSGHSGKTPPAEGHHGLGPDFSKCRLLPGLPDGVVSVQGSSPQAGRSVSPGLGLLSHSPGAGKGKGALTSLFENLPAARAVLSTVMETLPCSYVCMEQSPRPVPGLGSQTPRITTLRPRSSCRVKGVLRPHPRPDLTLPESDSAGRS